MPVPAALVAVGAAVAAAAPIILKKTALAVAIGAPLAIAGAKKVAAGGFVAHNWLKEKLPIEPYGPAEREDFPPLKVSVAEHLGYEIKLDDIELIKSAATTIGTVEAKEKTRGVIDQLNDEAFTVLFVGHFTKGKSALLNKLLGRKILKVGMGETTKTLTQLMYVEGREEAAYYHDALDDLYQIPLENVKGIPDDPPVSCVVANINEDILKHGAVLIDSPGLYASEETAELTREMMKVADAVVLVVDHYPEDVNDDRFVRELQEAGKADRLLVALNKMDKLSQEERETRIAKRKAWLDKWGIRANVYPLSNTDKLEFVDDDFNQFRDALVNYLRTGLPRARSASVKQRLKNTSAYLRDLCRETADFGREQDDAKRQEIKGEALAWWKDEFEGNVKKVLQANRREIKFKRESVKNQWADLLVQIKAQVSGNIQSANDGQLNSMDYLLGDAQIKIQNFLLHSYKETERQIRGNLNELALTMPFKGNDLPVPRQAGPLHTGGLVRWDKFRVPPQFATMGLLAYTLITRTTQGIFAAIGSIPTLFMIFALSPVINKVFAELQNALGNVATSIFKAKLQERINKEWPRIDDDVRIQIDAYFAALLGESDKVESLMDRDGRKYFDDKIATADTFRNSGRLSELEDFQKRLDNAANRA